MEAKAHANRLYVEKTVSVMMSAREGRDEGFILTLLARVGGREEEEAGEWEAGV